MRRRQRRSNIFFVHTLVTFSFYGLITFVVITFLLFLWYGRDLPTPGKLSASNLSQSTKILDRNGILLYDVFEEENRTYVTLKEIPKDLQEATIAIEDKDFYTNEGFSLQGYLRS